MGSGRHLYRPPTNEQMCAQTASYPVIEAKWVLGAVQRGQLTLSAARKLISISETEEKDLRALLGNQGAKDAVARRREIMAIFEQLVRESAAVKRERRPRRRRIRDAEGAARRIA